MARPIIFRYEPDLPDHVDTMTRNGLAALNVRAPVRAPWEWQPGDFWIDFPLRAGQDTLGKITAPCEKGAHPDFFELLTVLSELLAEALESSRQFEREWEDRNKWLEEQGQLFTRRVYHHLGNRTGDLALHLTELRLITEDRVCPPALRAAFQSVVEGLRNTSRRIDNTRATLEKWSLGQFVNRRPTDLVAIVRQATEEFFGAEVTDIVAIAAPDALYLSLDPDRLKEALAELMENSKQWAPTSEDLKIAINISEVHEVGARQVRLTYQNNGQAIAPQNLPELFKQDFSRRAKGTGFGLYYVSTIIERHDGTIEAEPCPFGARFEIRLPMPQRPITFAAWSY
jgi:signal transduction histidine kinase